MNTQSMKEGLTKAFYSTEFKLKQASPTILLVAGAAGVIGSTVLACKATTKAGAIKKKSQEELQTIHEVKADLDSGKISPSEYSEQDYKKDLSLSYFQTALKYVKLYAPSAGLMALSLGCILASNGIMKKRNLAIAAAYSTIDKSFANYRQGIIDRYGEKVDRDTRLGIKTEEVEEVKKGKDGKEKVVKKKVDVLPDESPNGYSKFFDESCAEYNKDPEYNATFLRLTQNHLNDLLRIKGHLFLNEVYDALGIEQTRAGQCVGWIYNRPDEPAGFVDFGIFGKNGVISESNVRFVNGLEPVILLEFNVQGNILNSAFPTPKRYR